MRYSEDYVEAEKPFKKVSPSQNPQDDEVKLLLVDMHSTAIIQKKCLENQKLQSLMIQDDGSLCIKTSGSFIDINAIEQDARGILKGDKEGIIDTNITDINIKILQSLLKDLLSNGNYSVNEKMEYLESDDKLQDFRIIYIDALKCKNGALPDVMLEICRSCLEPDNVNENILKTIKAEIEQNVWADWAVKVANNFFEKQEAADMKNQYIIVPPKIGANKEQFNNLCSNELFLNSKLYYIKGKNYSQYLTTQIDDHGIPFVLTSGLYQAYELKAQKIASKLEIIKENALNKTELIISFLKDSFENNEKQRLFWEQFNKYLGDVVNLRMNEIMKCINERSQEENRINIVDASSFQEKFNKTSDSNFLDSLAKEYEDNMQSEKAKAFVLMPYFNTKDELFKQSVKSVIEQDYKNTSLVIYNDGGNYENIKKILVELTEEQRKKIITLSNEKNCGVAEARVALQKYVKDKAGDNDFIFQLDSDDSYTAKNNISSIINKMNLDGSDILLFPFNYDFKNGKELNEGLEKTMKETFKLSETLSQNSDFNKEEITKLNSLGWTKVYSSKIFKELQINGGNEKYEDFVPVYIFLKPGIKISGIKEAQINFVKHDSSLTSARTEKDCSDIIFRLSQFKEAYEKNCKNVNTGEIDYKFAFKYIKSKIEQYKIIFSDCKLGNEFEKESKTFLNDLKTTNQTEYELVFEKQASQDKGRIL